MQGKIINMLTAVMLLLVMLFLSYPLKAQQKEWTYQGAISYPLSDTSTIRPYSITVDSQGNIWTISTIATDIKAHNSVWKAAPNDTVFSKVIDFGSYYDSSSSSYFDTKVGVLRGISALGQDIYLSGTQPFPLTTPNTLAFMYILRNGSISDSVHLGFGMRGGGFGTYIDCNEVTNDSIAFVGCPYDPNHIGPSFRAYNLTSHVITSYDKSGTPSQRPFGNFLLGDPTFAYSGYYSPAPGGPMDPNAYDQIRSIALVPGMNYGDSANAIQNSYFYTSRSSAPTNPTSGGLAIWTGGYSKQPALYSAQPLTDVAGDLSFGTFTYYGITADSAGNLFVCRADSSFKWVKIFLISGTFATEIGHLPSQTDPNNRDPNGAPFEAPTSVKLSNDQTHAYVVDQVARKVFVFTNKVTGVYEKTGLQPEQYQLEQNYPNPFNPSTMIVYRLNKSGNVTLNIFNTLGQKVATLIDGFKTAGTHAVNFDGSKLSSGIYFYTISAGNYTATKKMILLK